MEINELELITHLLLLHDLVVGFDDLGGDGVLLALVLLEKRFLLALFLLEEFLDSLGFNFACAAVLASKEDLALEVIGVFSDLCN